MKERRVSGPGRDWLTLEQCAEFLGVTEGIMAEQIAAGRFPQPVTLSVKNKRWNWMDVVAYMHLAGRGLFPEPEPPKRG